MRKKSLNGNITANREEGTARLEAGVLRSTHQSKPGRDIYTSVNGPLGDIMMDRWGLSKHMEGLVNSSGVRVRAVCVTLT